MEDFESVCRILNLSAFFVFNAYIVIFKEVSCRCKFYMSTIIEVLKIHTFR